jgi:hypothetical protein
MKILLTAVALLFACSAQAQDYSTAKRCLPVEMLDNRPVQLCKMAKPGTVLGVPARQRFRLRDIAADQVTVMTYRVDSRYGNELARNLRVSQFRDQFTVVTKGRELIVSLGN